MPDTTKNKILAIATGGTGGHFYPALAIAQTANTHGFDAVLIIGGHNVTRHLAIAEENGVRTRSLTAPKLPNSRLGAPGFGLRMLAAVLRADRIRRDIHPTAVLGMGSFACVPFCLASAIARTPLSLHEGNAVLGRANRWLARFANKLLLSLPLQTPPPTCPTFQTGFPIRPTLLRAARSDEPQSVNTAQARRDFGLAPDLPVLLVFGGSQGAAFINTVLPDTLRERSHTASPPLQVLHLAGSPQEQRRLTTAYDALGIPHHVLAHTEDMAACYHAADLVLARAGGATVAELAVFKKPAILIPFPAATDDHQTANARTLAKHHAAIHLTQPELTPKKLATTLEKILNSPTDQNTLSTQIAKFANPNAAIDVANHLIQ